ncbi:MAG: ABC transporter permease subunit [bacterium]|nr:ABC transporter permease subunit [bacterium]
MFTILMQKELKSILLSPKFAVTFGVCAFLLLLSVFIGISEYKSSVKQYETAQALADQQVRETSSFRNIQTKAFRTPDPMQIFVSGLTYDIGRWAGINQDNAPRLRNSAYSEDPIFAVFRFVDLAFIVTVVLSLLAVLFTYDAICGERESGTLLLVFSNAVPRAQYLLAKGIGAWLGLVTPIFLALLLSLLMVLLAGVSLTTEHWIRIGLLMLVSLLFFTTFIVIGLLISALTRRSSVSFLVSLVVWVLFVLIIPRAGVLAAGQMVRVPSVAEIQGARDAFAKDKWHTFHQSLDSLFTSNRSEQPDSMTEDAMWTHLQVQDSLRQLVENSINEYELKLYADLSQRRTVQEQLAFSLSRVSPASAYQLAAMSLAGTDLDLKRRYEDALNTYRTEFVEYSNTKTGDTPGGISISFSSDKGMSFSSPRDQATLDLSDMPAFVHPIQQLGKTIEGIVVDSGLLILYSLLAFAGAFFAFLRYDVR